MAMLSTALAALVPLKEVDLIVRSAFLGSVLLLLSVTGCKSPATAWCEQSAECGRLKGQTLAECTEKENDQVARWYDSAECAPLAERYEALAKCATSLSCGEYNSEVSLETGAKCKAVYSDYVAALVSYNKACGSIAPH